jgi:hypothetical protein
MLLVAGTATRASVHASLANILLLSVKRSANIIPVFSSLSAVRLLHDPPGHCEAAGDEQGGYSEAQL